MSYHSLNYLFVFSVVFLSLSLHSCKIPVNAKESKSSQHQKQILPEKSISIIDTMIIFDPENYTETITIEENKLDLFMLTDTLFHRKTEDGPKILQYTELYGSPGLTREDFLRIKTSVLDTVYTFDPKTKMESMVIRKYQKGIVKNH